MLLLNTPEIEVIQDRALNGYNPNNIFPAGNTPWEQVVASAALLMNDTIDEYWDGDLINGTGSVDEPGYIGHSTLACAFYYLIKGDVAYGNKAKQKVIAQAANPNPIWESYMSVNRSSALYAFIYSGYLIRLIKSFEYTRGLWTAGEIADFETYIDRAAALYTKWTEELPLSNFPQRRQRIYPIDSWPAPAYNAGTTYSAGNQVQYAVNGWQSKVDNNIGHTPAEGVYWTKIAGNYAASGQTYGGYDDSHVASWTHKTPSGVSTNRIYRIHADYSNQDALSNLFVGLWAIYKNDTDKIDRAKIWNEEMIKYALYADGCHAEYNRNSVSYPQLGTMWYSAITMEAYLIFADALARRGDNSLWSYTTNGGLWGNAGTTKSIQLALNTLISNIDGSVVRYFNAGVQDSYKLDTLGGTNYRYFVEMMFGIADRNLNIQAYKDTYLLNNSLYTYNYGGPQWADTAKWRGGCGAYAALPAEVYDMYGVYQYQPPLFNRKMAYSV